MDNEDEILDVVDENNEFIRTVSRPEWYGGENEKNPNEFIRYVDIFLFNKDGKLLVPTRSLTKKISPGCYDFSCGEHVIAGESFDTAAKRGLQEELGLTNVTLTQCRLMRPEEINVKGFSMSYVATIEDDVDFHLEDEVDKLEWFSIETIYDIILEHPEKFKTSYRKTFEACLLNKDIDVLQIIEEEYPQETMAKRVLITHSSLVANKALQIAKNVSELKPDLNFIYEAAMLHDIGLKHVKLLPLGLDSQNHYLLHGPLGAQFLRKLGLFRHARVCERHTGVGLSKEDIIKRKLPLVQKDFFPQTIEEEIVMLADCFFSKNPQQYNKEKSIEEVHEQYKKFGVEQAERFMQLCQKYKLTQ